MSVTFDAARWKAEIEIDREDTREYYLTQFDWRGKTVPEGFDGPRWFPANAEWRKEAILDRDAPGTGMRVQLQTSIGDLRDFDVYGTFVFQHNGAEQRLTAYRMASAHDHDRELFLPFKDSTTGKESYGAGRYMDIELHDGSEYVLDFNRAYNPLCAYTPRYNCPYPPPQNTLHVRVDAGEMIPFEHE